MFGLGGEAARKKGEENNMSDKQKEWERRFRTSLISASKGQEKRLNHMLAPQFIACSYEEQTVTIAFTVYEWEWNPRSELHGGSIAAMFDLSLGIAARCTSGAFQVATTDMSISYLRRVAGDDTVLMTIKIQKNGRQMMRFSGEARSKKTGKTVATVQSSYMILSHPDSVMIRQAAPSDLDQAFQVENRCFPPAEAASREAFSSRIKTFAESFFVAELDGKIIGLVNGCVTDRPLICDDLFEGDGGHDPQGENQMVFGLAVDPDFQRHGVAERLMDHFIEKAREAGRKRMVLTCKEELISYYERFGYVNRGVSASVHGGAQWYDMVMEL